MPESSNPFEEEMKRMSEGTVLSPDYRRKKIMAWVLRTAVAVAMYYLLWDYKWVRWTLLFYVPINLLGILSIIGWSFLLNKKMEFTKQMMEQANWSNTEEAEYEVVDEDDFAALDEYSETDPEVEDAEFEELDDDIPNNIDDTMGLNPDADDAEFEELD